MFGASILAYFLIFIFSITYLTLPNLDISYIYKYTKKNHTLQYHPFHFSTNLHNNNPYNYVEDSMILQTYICSISSGQAIANNKLTTYPQSYPQPVVNFFHILGNNQSNIKLCTFNVYETAT